jgi:hypothetical protein
MKTWKRISYKIARALGLYGTLDSERALREKNAEILRLKHELEHAHGFPVAPRTDFAQVEIIAPTPSQIASYEPPAPTTDGKIQAEGIRSRAATRQLQEIPTHKLQEQPKGALWAYYRKMPPEESITHVLEKMPPDLEALFENNNWLK